MLGNLSVRARILTSLCSEYPAALRDLSNAPAEIRIVGELPDFRRAFSIVGTRRATNRGLALAEGLGVATLKAAAASVPVIGFDAGGLPEAIVDGETGILVPPEDVEALQEAIATLAGDQDLRLRMGAAGRKRMQSEFSIDTMVSRHISLYESVLNG